MAIMEGLTSGGVEKAVLVATDGTLQTSGSGGGGGAVTIADGAAATIGTKADAAGATGSQTLISINKQIAAQQLLTNPVNVAQVNGATPSLTNPIFVANAEAADVTGTFTNGTQTTSVSNGNADGYAAGLISINGTYSGASGVFEVSDDGGTTFYPVICGRSDGTASETGYSGLTNISRQWSCPVGGNDTLRIRSTAVSTGTVNTRVGISAPPPSSNTTFGTVNASNFPATVDTNTGAASASTIRVVPSSSATVAVTQATASNLNATVVGTGTLAVQNTAATPAGTNTIGSTIIADKAITGATITTSSTGNISLGSVVGYNIATVQFVSASGTTLAGYFGASIDGGTTVFSINATSWAGNNSASTSTINSTNPSTVGTNALYRMAVPPNSTLYFVITTQAAVASYTVSGTAGNAYSAPPNIFATTNGNVASGATDSGNPTKVGGRYNATAPTFTDGQRGDLQLSSKGEVLGAVSNLLTSTSPASVSAAGDATNASTTGLFVNSKGMLYNGATIDRQYSGSGSAAAGAGLGAAAVEEAGRTFSNITTTTTTTVKSGKGNLHAIIINTPVASGTITMFDNTAGSGTKIATITNPVSLLGMGPISAVYDIAFATGLTIVTTGAQDITVSYR